MLIAKILGSATTNNDPTNTLQDHSIGITAVSEGTDEKERVNPTKTSINDTGNRESRLHMNNADLNGKYNVEVTVSRKL